jgi:hypothetical protein
MRANLGEFGIRANFGESEIETLPQPSWGSRVESPRDSLIAYQDKDPVYNIL